VYINIDPYRLVRMREFLTGFCILLSGQGSLRLVTHLDVDRADIDRFANAVRESLSSAAKAA
jgi:hypothetical protein